MSTFGFADHGEAAFLEAKTAAEGVRQSAVAAASAAGDHGAVKRAEAAFFRTVIAAAERYGVNAAPYHAGLASLGAIPPDVKLQGGTSTDAPAPPSKLPLRRVK